MFPPARLAGSINGTSNFTGSNFTGSSLVLETVTGSPFKQPEVSDAQAQAPAAPTQAAALPHRASQACDRCYQKKAKCDNLKPRCSGCSVVGYPCSYTREPKRRGPKPGYIAELESRIRELQAMITERRTGSHPNGVTARATTNASTTSTSPLHATAAQGNGSRMGGTNSHNSPSANVIVNSSSNSNNGGNGGGSKNRVAQASRSASPTVALARKASSASQDVYAPEPIAADCAGDTASLSTAGSLSGSRSASANSSTAPVSACVSPTLAAAAAAAPRLAQVAVAASMEKSVPKLSAASTADAANAPVSASLLAPITSEQSASTPFYGTGHHRSLTSFPLRHCNPDFDRDPLDFAKTAQNPASDLAQSHTPIRMDLIDAYFVYARQRIPMLHRPSFMKQIHSTSPLLLNSLYALSAYYLHGMGFDPSKEYVGFLEKARSLMHLYISQPSFETVFSLMSLSIVMSATCKSEAIVYVSATFRMAQQLDIFRETPEQRALPPQSVRQEEARRLWHFLIMVDRFGSFAAHLPPEMHEIEVNQCGMPLSYYYPGEFEIEPSASKAIAESFVYNRPVHTTTVDGINPYHKYLELNIIFGDVTRLTQGSMVDRSNHDESARQRIDASLMQWYESLPAWMQRIPEAYSLDPWSTTTPHWFNTHIHMMFHLARLALHLRTLLAVLQADMDAARDHPLLAHCMSSVHTVHAILSRFRNQHPSLIYMGSCFHKAVYLSALCALMALQLPGADAAQLTDVFETHTWGMHHLSCTWGPAQTDLAHLESLWLEHTRSMWEGRVLEMIGRLLNDQ
ncbi:hypothetical protein BC831DRAFT_460600 [Entophlyctis helioformis]|nr:hypothetical protein BC831DRAFT_460600 [Entophlyctis helioformis]